MELIEKERTDVFIDEIVTNGYHASILRKNYEDSLGKTGADNVFTNAYGALKYFPKKDTKKLSKILCVGKVQSGKTSFFIAAASLAFDNGYDIAYLIGGTSISLKDQNKERNENDFENDDDIVIKDLNDTTKEDVLSSLHDGKKVIIVALKNASRSSNLNRLNILSSQLSNISSIVIDDEGDEVSPGADKIKVKNSKAGKTHDVICDILGNFETCAYLSVTATPEANILMSIFNRLSPDYVTLVEAGEGYTGGSVYHDTLENKHVIKISDQDDFCDTIPDSFIEALSFFIFACCIKFGDDKKYSMLVHPSVLKSVHNDVAKKISRYITSTTTILSDPSSSGYADAMARFLEVYVKYVAEYPEKSFPFSLIEKNLPNVIENLSIGIYNTSKIGRDSVSNLDDNKKYCIYVGGNMLGRGLTLKNLIVTYMYRESKSPAVDTLYQRARWFGYKEDYFDICRVYMTDSLRNQFIVAAGHERDMWISLRAFLETNIDFKKFPRIFTLDDATNKMKLTRPSVSGTVVVSQSNYGFVPDESVDYNFGEVEENRTLYEDFFEKWKGNGSAEQFDTVGTQTHYVIKIKFQDFYNDFLSKYKYPFGSKFSSMLFSKMLKEMDSKNESEYVYVMIMRYNWELHPYRDTVSGGTKIKSLPQGANSGTKYEGDRYISKYEDCLYFQIHNIICERDNDYIPVIAMNNPITKGMIIKYVTGDNDYGV